VAADKAAEQAKSQIVAKSKMSKAEKSQQKKEKVRVQADAQLALNQLLFT
jgi:hypothetical protein